MVWCSNLGKGKGFFSSLERPDWLRGPPSFLFSGYRGYFSGVKCEVKYYLDMVPRLRTVELYP